MMWQSSLPRVCTIATWPLLCTDRKWCFWRAARIASTAILTLPSVPFLKPTGADRPDASSRCTWLSVVRAPIAPQDTRRSEEHTSELQSRLHLVCRLLLEKKKELRGNIQTITGEF